MDNYLFNLLKKYQNHNTSDIRENIYTHFKPIVDNISKKSSFEFLNSDLIIEFLELINKINLKKYNNDIAIERFIICCLKNKKIDILRKSMRDPKKYSLNLEILNDNCRYIESYLDLEDLFSKLTKKQKEVMYLEFLYGYTQAEISRITNLSIQAVSQRRERALVTIRQMLEGSF